jgi:hypothetical protein
MKMTTANLRMKMTSTINFGESGTEIESINFAYRGP